MVSVYCRCLAWCWLLATSWTEVIGLEGRPTASPWTFCQSWRTLRAVWVCVAGVKANIIQSTGADAQLSVIHKQTDWKCTVYICIKETSLCNLSVPTEIQLYSVNDIVPGNMWCGKMVSVNIDLVLQLSHLWSCPELGVQDLKGTCITAKHKDHSSADSEEKQFCLLFLFNIIKGSVCPGHYHKRTQWFVFLWWWTK